MSEMTPDLIRLVDTMAQKEVRSPQQVKAFHAGAECIIRFMAQVGVEQTVLPAIREEIRQLEETVRGAKAIRAALAGIPDPVNLDDRARSVVALTTALLEQYTDKVGADRMDDDVRKQITRSVSFTVWAYLSPGNAQPNDVETG